MCQGVTQQQSLEELHKLRLVLEHELLTGEEPDEQKLAELRESVDWVCHRLSSELGLKQVTPQTIAATVPLLQSPDAAIRQHTASTLSILASRSVFNQFRIGSQPGIITGLVKLLQDDQTWVRGSAAAALSHLAMHGYSTMQTRIGKEHGAIDALVTLLHDRDAGLTCAAALALTTLAEHHPQNQTLIGQTPGAVSGLVALLYGSDGALRSMAHAALKRLARNHPVNAARVRHEAVVYDSHWQMGL